MPSLEEMTVEEIDAAIAQLRDRKQTLKKSGKVAERKISTLEKRREKLMVQVRNIDEQIAALQREASVAPPPEPRRRGRRPKSASISVL